jgi:hypothetical protein
MMSHNLMSLAAAAPPAKGAPISDLLWASLVATVLSAGVLWIATAHRSGRIAWLGRLAAFSERQSGLPGWAALPSAIVGGSLLIAVFGFYWDVAKHIDTGRDPSPFGTAAHWPILIGLAGITLGGFLSIVLGADRRRVATALRLTDDWYAPLGGVLIFVCGAFALVGFPLDDVWHAMFGQDVTLWGPTHILMVGGASLSTLGMWVLMVEARRSGGADVPAPRGIQAQLLRLREPALAGAFLIGLSTLQGEFDFGVPQFQLLYQPVLIALAAGCGLVAARVRLGRGGALFAAGFYCVTFGVLSFLIHTPLDQAAVLHFPLYIAEALLVELVALRIPRERPLALGLVSGALIGTVGLAAEWGWSHVWMPLPWTASMLPQAAILGLAAALAGGTIGAFIGRALNGEELPRVATPRWALPAAAAVAVLCIAWPLPMTAGSHATATASLRTVHPGPDRTVAGTFRISPVSQTDDPQWLTALAWQGGGLVNDRLAEVRPGVYRTTRPIPAYGDWKAILRLANGRALTAVPIYLPNDPAIPAKGAPAKAHFTRTFVRDKEILQREFQGGPIWLTLPGYLIVLAIAGGWIVMFAAGLRRLDLPEGTRRGGADRSPATLAPSGGTA